MRSDGQSDNRDEDPLQTRGPLVLATSDIHSPIGLPLLSQALEDYTGPEPCLFLLAGDIVERGNVAAAKPVFTMIRKKFENTTIVAVFGNEEYHDREDQFRAQYPDVVWLSDQMEVLSCDKARIAVVGTRGAIDRLTWWQARHMPWLREEYARRPRIISDLIDEAKRRAERVVLLSHYALSKKTIIGEDPKNYPYLYSRNMERVVREKAPDAAVHGHAHKGRPFALVNGTPIYNVALPLNKSLVRIKFRARLLFS